MVRERLAGNELHDEVGAAVLLAVVEDVGDALVVDERGVAGLGAEALEEAGVAQVLVLEDLDGDGAADDEVGRLPDLAHAADRDARLDSWYRPPKVRPLVGLICSAPPL